MKTILLVDDAATVRLYHRGILERAGFTVLEAVNGMEALEMAVQHAVDLYLVDVNMPKLDGFGFLRALRQLDIAQAPAIMISTEMTGNRNQQAFEAGANLTILKPARPDTLLAQVNMLLGGAPP